MRAPSTNGARLSYVVIPLEDDLEREVTVWTKETGLTKQMRSEPAGYLVFFPRGHVMRIRTEAELAHYGLDKDPKFMDMKGLYDPNTAVGKLFSSQDEDERAASYRQLEAHVIQLATAKSGRGSIMPEQAEGLKIPFPAFELQEQVGAPTMLRQARARNRNKRQAEEV